jgi:hypothetical protein
LKRYKIHQGSPSFLIESKDGNWVEWDDVKSLIDNIDMLKKQCDSAISSVPLNIESINKINLDPWDVLVFEIPSKLSKYRLDILRKDLERLCLGVNHGNRVAQR